MSEEELNEWLEDNNIEYDGKVYGRENIINAMTNEEENVCLR